MVIDCCTLNKQTCMMYHFNQNVTADAKRYHTCLYVECTMIYDHICTQFRRSVSDSGHGNLNLKQLPRPTRVRIRPPQGCGREFWGKFQLTGYLYMLQKVIQTQNYRSYHWTPLGRRFNSQNIGSALYFEFFFSMALLELIRCQWENI